MQARNPLFAVISTIFWTYCLKCNMLHPTQAAIEAKGSSTGCGRKTDCTCKNAARNCTSLMHPDVFRIDLK